MHFNRLKTSTLSVVLGLLFVQSVWGRDVQSPILLHPRSASDAFAVASYRNIKVDDFRKLVIGAFQDAGFALETIEKAKNGGAQYKFAYPVITDGQARRVEVFLRVDENLDKSKKCTNCFLRAATFPEFSRLQLSSWMFQYELSRQVFPAIDQAYASIQRNGRASMDAAFGFDYKNQWSGEKSLYQNSFVGVEPEDLIAKIIDAYRAAGFTFVKEEKIDSTASKLTLSFPISQDQAEGVVYTIAVSSQFDARGRCYPCEISETYDPYQRLPAAGLSGIPNRLTLESRFSAARIQAFEALMSATGRYLRPGTVFTIPAKLAPLGSPRPQMLPAAVT